MGIDATSERHRSVEAMAEHYANLIDEHWPEGVVHLLSPSAGGWYAWAVASELLRRGRSLGLVAILDSANGGHLKTTVGIVATAPQRSTCSRVCPPPQL
jgi:arthrofactin-type cyclic lipopeptide synthetase C